MKRIIIALPTCGKTYACKRIKHLGTVKAIDLDIKGSKSLLTSEVRKAQTAYVKAVFNAGCDFVFTHNGALDFTMLNPDDNYTIDVIIRDCTAHEYAKLLYARGDSQDFIKEAYLNFIRWTDDMWELFDKLSSLGFKVRLVILPLKKYIYDFIRDEVATLVALRAQERN